MSQNLFHLGESLTTILHDVDYYNSKFEENIPVRHNTRETRTALYFELVLNHTSIIDEVLTVLLILMTFNNIALLLAVLTANPWGIPCGNPPKTTTRSKAFMERFTFKREP